jgi:hypothetical protein
MIPLVLSLIASISLATANPPSERSLRVTLWVRHCVHEPSDLKRLKFNRDNAYFQKIEELTRVALQKCPGNFMVGCTDLHGSLATSRIWCQRMSSTSSTCPHCCRKCAT